MNHAGSFDLQHVLDELRHHLPSQTPLKDFIHHNSLHAFQHLEFYEAIFTASKIFGYNVTFNINEYRQLHKIGRIRADVLDMVIKRRKGSMALEKWRNIVLKKAFQPEYQPRIGQLRAHWKSAYHLNLDDLVQPLLFRILCSYLDQGIAIWHFPFEDKGLLNAVRELEQNSFASFFRTKKAKQLFFDKKVTIEDLLNLVVGDKALYKQYIFDQQWAHRGWSGMVATIEDKPASILYAKKVELQDLIHFELLLEIDAIEYNLGKGWEPLAKKVSGLKPLDLFAVVPQTEWHEALAIWHDAFEWSYYDEVLSGARLAKALGSEECPGLPRSRFQAIFCLDEREGSLRRYIELVEPNCETLGCPGFFGVEFYFNPANSKFYEKLCPLAVTPSHLIKEKEGGSRPEKELLYSKHSHKFFRGFLASLSLGLVAAVKLVLVLFRPRRSPALHDAFAHMNFEADLIIENTDPNERENGLQVGFTVKEMAVRVEGLLRGIGLVKDFAPLVYVVAHGASSANNPHHGAYDCGACSGRPGSVNARVFAYMANHSGVRKILSSNGLFIPEDTQFISALHDTAADEMAFYDDRNLTAALSQAHRLNKNTFEHALNLNAKERSRRFASIDTTQELQKVREAIRRRSVSLFEPRQELGHGTNALCFIGHRSLTKRLFLDRRAFMNSYDYRTDPAGKLLLGVMRPIPPVCGGINLEYYFSRVDNQKLGAGTKLPHNVMGLIGVANSSDGDLRPGLPLQMIEPHDPVRLLVLVEHYPDVVLKTIQSETSLYEWFEKGWVHLVAIHPDENSFYVFADGKFTRYEPLAVHVPATDDIHDLIESAKEMETNHILHATQENLPVYIIK